MVLLSLKKLLEYVNIFGLFCSVGRFYWKIVEMESLAKRQSVRGLGEAKGLSASLMVLTTD
jgi:hypothetical protein